MPQTTRMNLRYPAGTDTPDVVRDMTNLGADLEALLPRLINFDPSQGGVMSAGDLKVTAGAGMTVNVAAGVAAVPDQTDTYPALTPVWRALLNGLVVTAANGSNPRIDQVVIDADGTLSIVAGVATAGATLDNRNGAAALANGLVRLADLLIPAASSSISAGNIRDRRPWARGAYSNSGKNAGSLVFSSATVALMDPLLEVRIECTGNPMRVVFKNGYAQASATAARLQFNFAIDGAAGAAPPPTLSAQWDEGMNPADTWFPINYEAVLTPAVGSHRIGMYGVIAGGGSWTFTGPQLLEIEEIVRQNANNN